MFGRLFDGSVQSLENTRITHASLTHICDNILPFSPDKLNAKQNKNTAGSKFTRRELRSRHRAERLRRRPSLARISSSPLEYILPELNMVSSIWAAANKLTTGKKMLPKETVSSAIITQKEVILLQELHYEVYRSVEDATGMNSCAYSSNNLK